MHKIYVIIFSFFTAHCFAMQPDSLVVASLELIPGQGLQDVVLPLPYYSPTEQEKTSCIRLPEARYDVITQPGQCVLVGHLQPCNGVVVYVENNSASNKCVVFHEQCQFDRHSLATIAQKEFSHYNPDHIKIFIYSNQMQEFAQKILRDPTTGHLYSFQDLNGGRTQKKGQKFLKKMLKHGLNIKDSDQITTYIHKSRYHDFDLGTYEFAELYLFVRFNNKGKIEINNVCPMHENMFGNFESFGLRDRFNITKHVVNTTNSSFDDHFDSKNDAYIKMNKELYDTTLQTCIQKTYKQLNIHAIDQTNLKQQLSTIKISPMTYAIIGGSGLLALIAYKYVNENADNQCVIL